MATKECADLRFVRSGRGCILQARWRRKDGSVTDWRDVDLVEDDNPELTDDDMAKMRPAREVLPELFGGNDGKN